MSTSSRTPAARSDVGLDRRAVSGDQQHGQVGPDADEPRRQLHPGHPWHLGVGDRQVELVGVVAERLQRLLGVGGGPHLVAEPLQLLGQHPEDAGLVVDHQQPLSVAAHQHLRGRRLRHRDRPRPLGEEHLHRGALARLAPDRDAAAVVVDDGVCHRQPQPGAAAQGLGGEEGLEDAVQHRRVDPLPGVGDAEADVRARLQRQEPGGSVAIEVQRAQGDRQTGPHGPASRRRRWPPD